LPAPADVQTIDHGLSGKPEAGDEVLLTFGGAVNPALILAGWDGAATAVTAHIGTFGSEDWLYFMDAADSSWLSGLGGVDLVGNYSNPSGAKFANSQMTLSGNTVTIVLGTASGTIFRDTSLRDMLWWTYKGTVYESGPSDQNF
jgi:hypothetical protein